MKTLTDDHRQTYERGRKKHREKIEFLKKKYRRMLKVIDAKEARSRWIERIAEGTGADPPPRAVPTYGEVMLDSDEIAAASLSPKCNTFA